MMNRIKNLGQEPFPNGSKKLIGEKNLYRIRQCDYRVIYEVDLSMREVKILVVRHRQEVYR